MDRAAKAKVRSVKVKVVLVANKAVPLLAGKVALVDLEDKVVRVVALAVRVVVRAVPVDRVADLVVLGDRAESDSILPSLTPAPSGKEWETNGYGRLELGNCNKGCQAPDH